MVQNNQFGGLQGEDPYAHILTFLNMCATFKINGVTDDAIRPRLFPGTKHNFGLQVSLVNQSQHGIN